jgi:hypothetical protein
MGASFKGSSDTEVLLAAFEEWGIGRSPPGDVGLRAEVLERHGSGQLERTSVDQGDAQVR